MENIEVLRDFNAWSWNILVNEIKDININLVYQILKIAINDNIFNMMQEQCGNIDVLELINEELIKLYPEKTVNKFLQLIYKMSIVIYIKISENENKRLKEEREVLEIELKEIKNKKTYIENTIEEKKKFTKELRNIDLIMNNKELLIKEYEQRNEKLSEYNKIFSISHLTEKMQKERKRILEKIDMCTKKVEPKTYIENRNKLQKDFDLLKDIHFDKDNDILKNINKLQRIFIEEILLNKIEILEEKNEIIDYIYELRYYNFLPYTKEKKIKDIIELQTLLEETKEKTIKKLYSKKIINTISTNEKNDIEIIKNIFELKIINLEDIYLEIKKQDNHYVVSFFDEKETLEKQVEISLEFNSKDKIKLNKKIKLFS